ncbi:MAG: DUF3501 family protein [Alphaproteobacteria bacterium]|nr:DUF3501 family protein [Alphaproteobacteria bacterium]
MTGKHEITRADVLLLEEYEKIRHQRRQDVSAIKKNRRVSVGPYATFYFENYDTMWWQVHEMLYIEKGGEDQIADELAAYNPLIPKGNELVATLMFEIENPDRRARFLARLGGVEKAVTLHVGSEKISAVPEADVERSTEGGKASSVHFLHFPFTPSAIAAFRDPETEVILGIRHDGYAHMASIPDNVHAALMQDFD